MKNSTMINLPFICTCGCTDIFMVPLNRDIESVEFEQSIYICQSCEWDEYPEISYELD